MSVKETYLSTQLRESAPYLKFLARTERRTALPDDGPRKGRSRFASRYSRPASTSVAAVLVSSPGKLRLKGEGKLAGAVSRRPDRI